MYDVVNRPSHYVEGRRYEPIDVLEEYFGSEPLLWQVGKYLSRAGRKGDLAQDLRKARYYLQRRLDLLERGVSIRTVDPSIPVEFVIEDWFPDRTNVPLVSVAGLLRVVMIVTITGAEESLSGAMLLLDTLVGNLSLTNANEAGYTFEQFEAEARKTIIFPDYAKLYYPALGLCGEAGEVAEKIKKLFRDHAGELTEDYRDKIVKELGDVLWYAAALCRDLDVPLSEPARKCIEKLKSRAERGTLQGNGDER